MTKYQDQALTHIAAVTATYDHVRQLHREPHANRAAIAQGYDDIRQGMKFAELYAHLFIGEQLERLTTVVEEWLDEPIIPGDPADMRRLVDGTLRPLAVVTDLDRERE